MIVKTLLAVLIVLCFEQSAYAYLDPGTGSFIIQMIAGSILVIVTSVGVFWGHIKRFICSIFRKKEE